MISEMEKRAVAQSCDSYSPKSIHVLTGFGSMCKSCANCTYYVKDHCTTNKCEDILNIIKMN